MCSPICNSAIKHWLPGSKYNPHPGCFWVEKNIPQTTCPISRKLTLIVERYGSDWNFKTAKWVIFQARIQFSFMYTNHWARLTQLNQIQPSSCWTAQRAQHHPLIQNLNLYHHWGNQCSDTVSRTFSLDLSVVHQKDWNSSLFDILLFFPTCFCFLSKFCLLILEPVTDKICWRLTRFLNMATQSK